MQSLAKQAVLIMETAAHCYPEDPTYDIDAAIRVCAIANVLMGAQLRLEDAMRI